MAQPLEMPAAFVEDRVHRAAHTSGGSPSWVTPVPDIKCPFLASEDTKTHTCAHIDKKALTQRMQRMAVCHLHNLLLLFLRGFDFCCCFDPISLNLMRRQSRTLCVVQTGLKLIVILLPQSLGCYCDQLKVQF